MPMGPWDTAAAHSKLWVIEDDQRTPFGSQSTGPFGYCPTVDEYVLANKKGYFSGGCFILISFGSPHVRTMGRTCGEPNKIDLAAIKHSSNAPPRYAAKARLNLLVTGMHGVGSYLMDQVGNTSHITSPRSSLLLLLLLLLLLCCWRMEGTLLL